jgi:hypothetical protein
MSPIDLAAADKALDWLRQTEWVLPVRTQAAIDLVAEGYEHLRGAVNKLLAACDEADAAVTEDHLAGRRALSTGHVRRLLTDEEAA